MIYYLVSVRFRDSTYDYIANISEEESKYIHDLYEDSNDWDIVVFPLDVLSFEQMVATIKDLENDYIGRYN